MYKHFIRYTFVYQNQNNQQQNAKLPLYSYDHIKNQLSHEQE